jgi:peptidoglycan hydrolase CwlO-like protein
MDLLMYERIMDRFDQLERIMAFLRSALHNVEQKENAIMVDLQPLKDQVTRITSLAQASNALIVGLAAKIEELKGDPAALQELADELRTDADSMSESIEANTGKVSKAKTSKAKSKKR